MPLLSLVQLRPSTAQHGGSGLSLAELASYTVFKCCHSEQGALISLPAWAQEVATPTWKAVSCCVACALTERTGTRAGRTGRLRHARKPVPVAREVEAFKPRAEAMLNASDKQRPRHAGCAGHCVHATERHSRGQAVWQFGQSCSLTSQMAVAAVVVDGITRTTKTTTRRLVHIDIYHHGSHLACWCSFELQWPCPTALIKHACLVSGLRRQTSGTPASPASVLTVSGIGNFATPQGLLGEAGDEVAISLTLQGEQQHAQGMHRPARIHRMAASFAVVQQAPLCRNCEI